MKIFLCLCLMLSSSICYGTGEWVPVVNQQPLVIQEQVIPQLVVPDNAIAPPPRPLVRKIKWVMTPNVTFVEAPYYTRGLFGGVVVKKQFVMHTTWVWTPVEVWE